MITIGILGDSFSNTLESMMDRRRSVKSLLSNYGEKDEIELAIFYKQIDCSRYSQMMSGLGHGIKLIGNDFKLMNNRNKTIDRAIVFSTNGLRSTKYIEQLTDQGIQFDIIRLTEKIEEFKTKEFHVYYESEDIRFNIPENLELGFKWHDISKKYWLMDEGETVIQSFIRDCHNGMKISKNGDSYRIYLKSARGLWYDFTNIANGVIYSAWSEAHIYTKLNILSLFDALVDKLQVISANPKAFKYAQYVILEDI